MPFDPASAIAGVLDDALREAREDLAQLDRLTAALAGPPGGDPPGSAELLAEYGMWLERAARRTSASGGCGACAGRRRPHA